MKIILSLLLAVSYSIVAVARLPAPNDAGASAGHHILRAANVDAASQFWTALGAEPTALATIKLMKIPGVLLFISATRKRSCRAAARKPRHYR